MPYCSQPCSFVGIVSEKRCGHSRGSGSTRSQTFTHLRFSARKRAYTRARSVTNINFPVPSFMWLSPLVDQPSKNLWAYLRRGLSRRLTQGPYPTTFGSTPNRFKTFCFQPHFTYNLISPVRTKRMQSVFVDSRADSPHTESIDHDFYHRGTLNMEQNRSSFLNLGGSCIRV